MQAIHFRTIPFLDSESLASGEAREVLLRDDEGYLLYLSDAVGPNPTEERLIRVEAREALIWLNEEPQNYGSFWD